MFHHETYSVLHLKSGITLVEVGQNPGITPAQPVEIPLDSALIPVGF